MTRKIWRLVAATLVLTLIASGCARNESSYSEKNFIGEWQSSRVGTPVYLQEDGEWDLKTENDEVQQYGIWQFFDNQILWTVRVNGQIRHDLNPVLSVTADEFQLQEKDGSVTTFHRL